MSQTKPYFIRALYEWCTDNEFTPFISVKVDSNTIVPMEYVLNDEIILNISQGAAHNLALDNELIQFTARFNGVSRKIQIPIDAVKSIFTKETNQGITFSLDEECVLGNNTVGLTVKEDKETFIPESKNQPSTNNGKPELRVIK